MRHSSPRVGTIPDAAWFAEHVMGWKRRKENTKYTGYIDEKNNVWCLDNGLQRAWDPRRIDADAIQMFQHAAVGERYVCLEHDHERWTCRIGIRGARYGRPIPKGFGCASRLRAAICRAAEAWVLAREEG